MMIKSGFSSVMKLMASGTILLLFLFLNSCGERQSNSNLRTQYHNDLESYDGWIGISGYYNLVTGDAHSGRHSMQTDSISIYSISFAKPIVDLSLKPVKKINVSVWVKCLSTPANGSYVVSFEQGGKSLNYFSFDLKEKDVVVNEWVRLKGTAELPSTQPKDGILKIYFWNKSKSVILVDDFEFEIIN